MSLKCRSLRLTQTPDSGRDARKGLQLYLRGTQA